MNDIPPSPTLIPKPLAFKKKPTSLSGPPPQYNVDLKSARPRHESAPCSGKDHPSMQDKLLFHDDNAAYPDVSVHCNGKNSRNLKIVLKKRTTKNPASKRYEPVHEISPIPSRIGELRPHYERRSAPAKISGTSTQVKRKPSPQEIRKSLLSGSSDINPAPAAAPLPSAFLLPPTPIEKTVPAHGTQLTHSNVSLKPPKFRVINGIPVRTGPPAPSSGPSLHEHPSYNSTSVSNSTPRQPRPEPLDESLIHPALRSEFSSQGEIRYLAPRPHDADQVKSGMGLERTLPYAQSKARHGSTDTKHSVSFIAGSTDSLQPTHPSKMTSITVSEVSENESGQWTKRGFLPKRIPRLQQWMK